MPTTTTTEHGKSEESQNDDEGVDASRQMLWHKGEGEATEMFQRGAPTHLVVQVLELLAPMVEAQLMSPYCESPEYLREVTSQQCWDVVSGWIMKLYEDSYEFKSE